MQIKKWIVFGAILVLFATYLLVSKLFSSPANIKAVAGDNSYIGDQQCKSCHQNEWKQWQLSDHFKAMLPANDSTVKGNFNNVTYKADGVVSKFFKKGNDFYINTEGPDGRNHDYKVMYTFGYFPLQQYLIEFPGGRMQATRLSWDAKQNKWFHQYPGKKIAHNDWLHWTKDAQNWNTMCSACHSTNLQKNYDLNTDSYQTTYTNINVSCESCHGPGKLHVQYANTDYKKGEKVAGHYINLVKTQSEQLTTCVPCHAVKSELSNQTISSQDLLDNYIPQLPTTERFYADGQIREEDYIYASFLQSKMMNRGVTCSNCHNSHTGKILYASNQLCLQCHAKTYDAPSHHFHKVNTVEAECKSCHMPGQYYMGNDYRHDHSFRVPRPDLSVQYYTPNACNNCHKDKSYEWSRDVVIKFYGPKRKYHFSEDLIPGSKMDAASEAHLLKLVKDTVPAIVKATSIHYLGNTTTQASLIAIRNELNNSNSLIRYNALRGLQNFSPDSWLTEVAPLLADKVRAVRIAAADLFTTVPSQQIPEEYKQAFTRANGELKTYLLNQADFADGNVLIADHYLKQNDYDNAQKFYLRALKKDNLLNYARLNLSAAYSATGKNEEALKTLKTAATITPQNDRVFYNLGLLYVEDKDTLNAMKSFEKAVQLKTVNPRVYYNYSLLLFFKHQKKKAIEMILKAAIISPDDEDIKNAISFMQQNGK